MDVLRKLAHFMTVAGLTMCKRKEEQQAKGGHANYCLLIITPLHFHLSI